MKIIGTQIKEGQGLGNRLFVYVSTRAIAKKKGFDFSILNSDILERGIKDSKGIPFIDMDFGCAVPEEIWQRKYEEKSSRLFIGNSIHDIEHGADVSEADMALFDLESGTLIEGILQSPQYFDEYKADIKNWLRVKPEYDSYEYFADDLCVINIRGGEYAASPELYLGRKYWLDAMKNMRSINPDMRFMIITDSVEEAHKILPEIPAYHFEVWKDYITIKNAKYLIISNSSFAFFPAYTSETAKVIIAPKYWARHNVSDGYWCCEQNIYKEFKYQDRQGKLFSANDCLEELMRYKECSPQYKILNMKLEGCELKKAVKKARVIKKKYWIGRAFRSLQRRLIRKNR